MKFIKLILVGVIASGVLASTAAVAANTTKAVAAEQEKSTAPAITSQTPKTSTTTNKKTEQTTSPTDVYQYVAQAGDSYTLMMRKAVQTYGLKHKVKITPAAIIFAETNLTRQAGSPNLKVGQKVSVSEKAVAPWVQKAQKLTPAQQLAWGYYVQFVDFNTAHVGQP